MKAKQIFEFHKHSNPRKMLGIKKPFDRNDFNSAPEAAEYIARNIPRIMFTNEYPNDILCPRSHISGTPLMPWPYYNLLHDYIKIFIRIAGEETEVEDYFEKFSFLQILSHSIVKYLKLMQLIHPVQKYGINRNIVNFFNLDITHFNSDPLKTTASLTRSPSGHKNSICGNSQYFLEVFKFRSKIKEFEKENEYAYYTHMRCKNPHYNKEFHYITNKERDSNYKKIFYGD